MNKFDGCFTALLHKKVMSIKFVNGKLV